MLPALTVDDTRQAEAELAPCLTAMIARLAEPSRTAISLTSLGWADPGRSGHAGGRQRVGHEVARAARTGTIAPDARALLRDRGRRPWRRVRFPPASGRCPRHDRQREARIRLCLATVRFVCVY